MTEKIIATSDDKGYVEGGCAFASVHEDTLVNVFGMDRLEARKTGLPTGEYELEGVSYVYRDPALSGAHQPRLKATGKAVRIK